MKVDFGHSLADKDKNCFACLLFCELEIGACLGVSLEVGTDLGANKLENF